MGLFSKIKDVKFNAGGVYFEPGTYVLECLAVKTGETRERRAFFVAEFQILESTVATRPVGTSVSYMVMLDKHTDTALANVKQVAAALFDCPQDDVDEAGIEALVGQENPGRGKRVNAIASMIKTKAGKDFTKVVFSPESD